MNRRWLIINMSDGTIEGWVRTKEDALSEVEHQQKQNLVAKYVVAKIEDDRE